MEINKIFKIYALPNLFISNETFDDYKYESTNIDKIIKKIKKDKGYNIRINPDESSIVFGDFDKTTLEQFNEFLNILCKHFDIQIDEISYSSSKNNTSFHFSIPSIETNPKNLKNVFKKKVFDRFSENLDLSIYSKHWFRLPGQTLQGKPEPHIIIKGSPEDFIVNYTEKTNAELQNEEPEEKPENKDKSTIEYNTDKTHKEYIEKLIDLLDDSRADNRDEWKDISFIINNELGDEGLELFQQFSSRSAKYDSIKDDKWYLNLRKSDSGLFIGSLIKLVKEDNLEGYEELRKEFIKKTTKPFRILEYEQDIAQYIIDKYLKNNYVCVSFEKNEIFYYYNGNIWTKDRSNITIWNYITIDYVKEITDFKATITKEDNKELYSAVLRVLSKLKGKAAGPNSIINLIGHKLFKPTFYDLCDENIYLLGFDNGVYDTRTKEFRVGKPEDYITKSVGFDFPLGYGEYKNDVDNFFKQIYPNENVRKYALQQQAQAISGKKGKDIIFTHTGRGGNGKSILQELTKFTYGDYYLEIPSTMLTKQNKMDHNKPDPFFTEFKGCRMATANEPPDGSTINDTLFKVIGSKEGVKYRTLYSLIVEKLKMQFQLNIYCNNKLNFNAEDGGVVRRLRVIDYISKFDETPNEKNNIYKIDCELSEKVKNWRQDYMRLLLDLYNPDYVYNEPIEIKESSSKYADSNNDVKKFVQQNYIQTNNNDDFIILKDIKASYQLNKEFDQVKLKTLSDSLQKILNTNLKETHKHNRKTYYSVFIGWKVNDEDDAETSNLDI